MFNRQRVLYYVIKKTQPVTKTRLVKIMFLIKYETNIQISTFYDFLPYQYGPYSFQLKEDLDLFTNNRIPLVLIDKNTYSINNLNFNSMYEPSIDIQIEIDNILDKFKDIGTSLVVEYVYDKYPEYTIKSKIQTESNKKKILGKSKQPKIFSLGYEGLSIDAFMNKIITNGIDMILDVRNNPYSRKYGFSKVALNHICDNIKVEYHNIPELGIPSNLRKELYPESSKTLFEYYQNNILTEYNSKIQYVMELINGRRPVFICFEKDKNMCHRSYLIKSMPLKDMSVKHL